ncbi:hypothetical protein [Paracoccus litorisediminis]|uniref:Uncharacterized protein n=1 Tax=Paracoccus litorisediminis TaxID=2006130 RepID=A0A844HXC4_9RHOB|nr:hypothetical protein [Paracoccus litorisediminis]MTH62151.1 hypothetical protein [Paracoccus litorisediminis]
MEQNTRTASLALLITTAIQRLSRRKTAPITEAQPQQPDTPEAETKSEFSYLYEPGGKYY